MLNTQDSTGHTVTVFLKFNEIALWVVSFKGLLLLDTQSVGMLISYFGVWICLLFSSYNWAGVAAVSGQRGDQNVSLVCCLDQLVHVV